MCGGGAGGVREGWTWVLLRLLGRPCRDRVQKGQKKGLPLRDSHDPRGGETLQQEGNDIESSDI